MPDTPGRAGALFATAIFIVLLAMLIVLSTQDTIIAAG